MTSRVIPVAPFDYVVFGGSGDLARRKLLPALYHRFRDGQIAEGSRIVAVSRSKLSNDAYRTMAEAALSDFLSGLSMSRTRWSALCACSCT